jgi:PAS domain S-box-containing protein
MKHSPAVIYIKDGQLRHVYANRLMLETFGITRDDFVGTRTRDFLPSDLAASVESRDERILSGSSAFESMDLQYEIDGRETWWHDAKFPIVTASGERFVGGLALELTERKLAEMALAEAYEEIKQLKDRLEAENVYLREEVRLQHRHGKIVGSSPAIRKTLTQVEQVAGTESTVLIQGETGSGKELFAEAIHSASSRSGKTLVKVNCAALPSTLIESELFGREKGAYTGALTKQAGRFEVADRSTIFLDEVGELQPEVQVKLLRVLEEGRFERLGSPESRRVDVRLIAATNRDLRKAVDEGSFREDLYYRLRVFPIVVPPLRERPEDIPQLVWHFVRELNDRMGKKVEHVAKRTMEALQRHPWPGNVRELRNVVEHGMIVSTGRRLVVEHPELAAGPSAQGRTLADVERRHIVRVLEQTRWRVRGDGGAAEILGLKPTTLDARMKKLGIVRPKGR